MKLVHTLLRNCSVTTPETSNKHRHTPSPSPSPAGSIAISIAARDQQRNNLVAVGSVEKSPVDDCAGVDANTVDISQLTRRRGGQIRSKSR